MQSTLNKLTKSVYNKSKTLLEQELAAVRAILELAQETEGVSLPYIDMWDEYHDREYELEQAIAQLDRDYAQRNWTAADYNTASLMAQNID